MAVPSGISVTENSHSASAIHVEGVCTSANGTLTSASFQWYIPGVESAWAHASGNVGVGGGGFGIAISPPSGDYAITGLQPHTTYRIRATFSNASGQGFGGSIDVTTSYSSPSVSLDYAGNGNPDPYTYLIAGGTPTGAGGGTIGATGFQFATDAAFSNIVHQDDLGAGAVGTQFTTAYQAGNGVSLYVRAYVENELGFAFSGGQLITTQAYAAPTLAHTSTPWARSSSSISPKATVSNDGGQAITDNGFVLALYDANAAPTIGGTGVTQKSQAAVAVNTEFADTYSGLTGGRVYALRAYAINSQGTTYGPVVQIVTSVISGFAQTHGFSTPTLHATNVIPVTGLAQTHGITTPVVSSAHLTGKAQTHGITTPTIHGANTIPLTGFAEVAAFGRVFPARTTAASVTLVQTKNGNTESTGAASHTITITSSTLHSLMVIMVAIVGTTPAVSSITDNASGGSSTYVLAQRSHTRENAEIWYCLDMKAGATTITVNHTSAAVAITAREYTGLVTASTFDKAAVGSGTGIGNITSSATAATTQAAELLIAMFAGFDLSAPTVSAGAGFGHFVSRSPDAATYLGIEDQSVNAIGTYSAAFTESGTSIAWDAIIATFKMSVPVQPVAASPTGFAQSHGITTPTVTSKNTAALTGLAQTHGITTPVVRDIIPLTGFAQTHTLPIPAVTSRNVIALTGLGQSHGISTPAVTPRNVIFPEPFLQYTGIAPITIVGANRIQLTGFAQSHGFGATIAAGRNTAALTGFAQAHTFPTITLAGALTRPVTGFAQSHGFGSITARGLNTVQLAGFAEAHGFGTITARGLNVAALTGYAQSHASSPPTIVGAAGLALTGYAQSHGYGTATARGLNIAALAGFAQSHGFPIPTLSSSNTIVLTGYAQSHGYGTISITGAARVALTGFAQSTGITTPAVSTRNVAALTGYAQSHATSTITTYRRNTIALTGFTQPTGVGTASLDTSLHAVLTGFAQSHGYGSTRAAHLRDWTWSARETVVGWSADGPALAWSADQLEPVAAWAARDSRAGWIAGELATDWHASETIGG